jgi:hypothetical protein
MATNNFKVLAASRPAATTEAKLYGPASGKEAVGELWICNQDTAERTYRVALTDTDATAANDDFIIYDKTLAQNATDTITFHLQNPNTIRIKASVASKLSFVASGNEITT